MTFANQCNEIFDRIVKLYHVTDDVDAVFNNPFDEGTIFLFCGRRCDRIKALLWEGDGFLLLYKRLSNGWFQWPRSKEELRSLSSEQYHWLMSGLTVDPTIHKADVKYIL